MKRVIAREMDVLECPFVRPIKSISSLVCDTLSPPIPQITRSETSLCIEQWTQCCRQLGHWDTLADYSRGK